jgi:hypothetical protein
MNAQKYHFTFMNILQNADDILYKVIVVAKNVRRHCENAPSARNMFSAGRGGGEMLWCR